MGNGAEWEWKTFLFSKNLSLGLTPAETAGGDVPLPPDTPRRRRCLGEGLADHSMNVPTEDLPPPVYLAISELIHLYNTVKSMHIPAGRTKCPFALRSSTKTNRPCLSDSVWPTENNKKLSVFVERTSLIKSPIKCPSHV